MIVLTTVPTAHNNASNNLLPVPKSRLMSQPTRATHFNSTTESAVSLQHPPPPPPPPVIGRNTDILLRETQRRLNEVIAQRDAYFNESVQLRQVLSHYEAQRSAFAGELQYLRLHRIPELEASLTEARKPIEPKLKEMTDENTRLRNEIERISRLNRLLEDLSFVGDSIKSLRDRLRSQEESNAILQQQLYTARAAASSVNRLQEADDQKIKSSISTAASPASMFPAAPAQEDSLPSSAASCKFVC